MGAEPLRIKTVSLVDYNIRLARLDLWAQATNRTHLDNTWLTCNDLRNDE